MKDAAENLRQWRLSREPLPHRKGVRRLRLGELTFEVVRLPHDPIPMIRWSCVPTK